MSTFIEQCVKGIASVEDAEDYVDEWHLGESKKSLAEYLGMTKEEYRAWMEDSTALHSIIKTHSKEFNRE